MVQRYDVSGFPVDEFGEPVFLYGSSLSHLDPYHLNALKDARRILSKACIEDAHVSTLVTAISYYGLHLFEGGLEIVAAHLYERVKAAEKALLDRSLYEVKPMIIVASEEEKAAILAKIK